MKIIPLQDVDIPKLAAALQEGKTIVYPTETCYGLGCNAANQIAVDAIFKIKQRQKDKPLLVIAPDVAMMMDYVAWDMRLDEIADKYWPGPLTVVAPGLSSSDIAQGVLAEDETIAFRITDHSFSAELATALGKPIVSTSANIASLESPYDIGAVLGMFEHASHQPDIIIDAGELPHQSPSTIVRFRNGSFEVIRQGAVVVV